MVNAPSRPNRRGPALRPAGSRSPELWAAISIIMAATLATFLALFLTSRPFDPMNATVAPQLVVPPGPSVSPSTKPSATPTPAQQPVTEATPQSPGGETVPDDATIQSRIEEAMSSNPDLSQLDVSTLVENGKVTIVGSVKSTELKQRVETVIRAVKGVASVDNQLVITEATP